MSSRELISLAPVTGWKYSEALHDHGADMYALSGRPRRRSARNSSIATQELFAQSLQQMPDLEHPSHESSVLATPPSLVSARTRSSTPGSVSELSSVPDDISDREASSPPPNKRRKVEIDAKDVRSSRQSRTRKSPNKDLTELTEDYSQGSPNSSRGAPPKKRNSSSGTLIVRLRVEKEILQRFVHSYEEKETSLARENINPPIAGEPSPNTKRKRVQPKKDEDSHSSTSSLPPSPSSRLPVTNYGKNLISCEDAFYQTQSRPRDTSQEINGPIPEELHDLVEVSQQLMNLSSRPIAEKPTPIGSPEVWADGRQALCEALPYYRAYQSAGYCTGGFALSFMFDQEGNSRDYMDSDVVIARAGGGLSRDKTTGKMARQGDQAANSQVNSVRNSMNQYNPVAILSGNRNSRAPSKMPHIYNVLDWFKPTHIWFEKSGGMANIRYRFEKLKKSTESWWTPSNDPEVARIGSVRPPEVRNCLECKRTSPQVYLQGWMCLEDPACPRFWKLDSGQEPQEDGLLYDPRFLKQYTPWPHSSEPQPLRPDCMKLGPTPMIGEDVSWAAGKGLVCPYCGRCNSREAWEGWECGNPTCDFKYCLPHANVPAHALLDPYNPLSSGYTFSKDWFSDLISLRVEFQHNYRINYFTIPGIEGFIAHFIANRTINEESGGPDDMWTELQTADLGLRRRPLGCSTLQGPMLTQHFSVNYGMPYKFIAATASRSFKDASPAINSTRSRLNWAARQCVGPEQHTKEAEFNEILALGYFERQKIDYHDDGEYGLGPTIATLSLGAPAAMKIRLKAKHQHGVSKAGAFVDRPPLPGCDKYEQRLTAHKQLEEMKQGGDVDRIAYKERLKALPKELGLQSKGHARDVLNMHLGHGDIVIMHGARIQEYYEHAVEPIGKLRFALTCRYIDPNSLKPEERPTYEVDADEWNYDGSNLPAVDS